MELANNYTDTFPEGTYSFVVSMTAGTAALHIKDPSDSDSAYQAIPEASKSSSTSFNVTLKGTAMLKAVLTGDAKMFMLLRTP